MSNLIAKIRAALDETEAWARAACQAYPYAIDQTIPVEGVSWEWVTGDEWDPVTPDPMADEFVAPAGYNCWLATKETWPDDRGRQRRQTYTHDVIEMDAAAGGHIIRHDPKTVLRQVAGHRKILEIHTDSDRGLCQTCVGWTGANPDPCPSLYALADAVGVVHP